MESSDEKPIPQSPTYRPDLVEIRHPELVRWKCIRCHTCCGDTTGHIRHIRMLPSETWEISRLSSQPPSSFCFPIKGFGRFKFEMHKQASGNCTFLNGDTCGIYRNRPLTCRFYPFFLKQLSENRFEFCMTNERCPGLGRGPLLNKSFYFRLFRNASRRISSQDGFRQSF